MDDILIKTKSGGFKTVNAVASNPVKEDDLMKILQPKTPTAPPKVAVSPSWRDKIEAPVIQSDKNQKSIPSTRDKTQDFGVPPAGGTSIINPTPPPADGPLLGKERGTELPKKVSAPAFYFDVKDEEEAKEFKDNNLITEREKKEQSINLGAAKIARQIKDTVPEINIASPEDLARLSKIVASRLRDIRSLVDTKDSLMKKTDSGGLSITLASADKIIKIIEKEKIKWQEKPEEYIKSGTGNQKLEIGNQEMAYNRQPLAEKIPKWKEELAAGPEDIDNPQLQKIVAAIKAGNRQPTTNNQQSTKPTTEDLRPTINNRQQVTDNREDFNYQSYLLKEQRERRVMGPVEELLNMDLKEFRALGRSPKESVNKLYEKIMALANVSLEERAKGIAAWKSSPLYQLYVNVGEESLIKSLPIEGILKNKPSGLTWDEFQAIGDLNEQLNY
ncbi:MAG: hypothetical protein PHT40_01970 [Patescibacteria group bacterium]|nr:hypothetical protein [Patescibacteria group bacterium]